MPATLPPYTAVVAQAQALGFAHVGYLAAPDVADSSTHLTAWLDQGYHADMQWMADGWAQRANPLSLMPGAQSILCVTLNYYPGPVAGPAKIARYAQGDDYHDVVKAKLKQLLGWLQAQYPGIEGHPLTDSAPILEKPLALQAGLGWQGKHSNVITRSHGSWVFLGELLLNVTFPDAPQPEPVADLCGRCRRCIDACPTEAIVADGVVDAGKCISYWTIESKAEAIPEPIAEKLDGWIFGCDICQEVCPWNIKFAQPTAEAAFMPRPWNKTVRVEEILALTLERFRRRYRKSPIKRTKLAGLLRNVKTFYISVEI